jgi:hypothetical protein
MGNHGRIGGPFRASQAAPPVMLLVLVIIVCVLPGLLTEPVYAGEPDQGNGGIVIEADITEYRFEPEGTVVVAEGNAKVTYEDLFISADCIRIYAEPGELLACGRVVARQGMRTVKCDLFTYNLYTGKGRILEPDAHISDVYVRGSEMNLAPGILTLDNAYVTGCELDDPCYRVSSKKVVIYPDDRVVVEWPTLWFGRVPVMIVPRLAFPLKGESVALGEGEDKSVPVPRFSYDSSNGFLIGLTYRDKTQGWAQLCYEGAYVSKRRGIKARAEADLALGPGKTGVLEGAYSSWEGFSAKARYGMSLSNLITLDAIVRYVPAKSDDDSAKWKGFERGTVEARLVAETVGQGPVRAKATLAKDVLSTGDLYRIPELEVSLKPVSIPGNIGSFTLSGGFGQFEEPSRSVKASRTHLVGSYASPTIPLSGGVTGSLSLSARRAWYETGDTLNSFKAGTRVKANFGKVEAFGGTVPQVKAGISYDYTYVRGVSPFRFDKVSPSNKASANVDYRVSEGWSIGVSTSYDFKKQSVDDIGVLLMHHNHCYDICATWNKKQQLFGIDMKFTR